MKRFKRSLMMIAMAVMFTAILLAPLPGKAATDNPSTGSTGYESWIFHLPGTYSSTVTPVKFKVPWPYRAVSISTYARSLGADGTYTVDVQQASTSLLSTPIPIATPLAGTVVDGTLATTPTIADEATVSIILTLAGTTPTMTDLTVVMGVKRR